MAEKKYVDAFPLYAAGVDVAGIIVPADFTPIQGAGVNQRVGNKITRRSIKVWGSMKFGDTTNIMRVVWFTWNENSSVSTPTAGDILATMATEPWNSPLNRPNLEKRRFTPMMDKRYNLSSEKPQILFHWKFIGKRLPHKAMEYSGTDGLGKIYMLLVSDSLAISHPTIETMGRFTFTDV